MTEESALDEAQRAFDQGDYGRTRHTLRTALRSDRTEVAVAARALFDRTQPSRAGGWLIVIAACVVAVVCATWMGHRP